jgi:hypothetical protein
MLLHMRMIVTITLHRVANTFFGPNSMGMACKSKVFHKQPQRIVLAVTAFENGIV